MRIILENKCGAGHVNFWEARKRLDPARNYESVRWIWSLNRSGTFPLRRAMPTKICPVETRNQCIGRDNAAIRVFNQQSVEVFRCDNFLQGYGQLFSHLQMRRRKLFYWGCYSHGTWLEAKWIHLYASAYCYNTLPGILPTTFPFKLHGRVFDGTLFTFFSRSQISGIAFALCATPRAIC